MNRLAMRSKGSDVPTDEHLAFLIHDVARSFTAAYAALMAPLGLSRSQARVIAYVMRFPGLSQVQLAEYIGVGRMAMTGLLERMEKKTLVTRVDDPEDGRVKRIYLTREAKRLRPQMEKLSNHLLNEALVGVSVRDQATVKRALLKLRTNITALIESPEALIRDDQPREKPG
jgi:DNA-binding MarR family transcriptional regulator